MARQHAGTAVSEVHKEVVNIRTAASQQRYSYSYSYSVE